jgi:hypothetical protein
VTDDASASPDEVPSTRHGDVLLTVWIVVGATVLLVLSLSETLRLPRVALAVVGALAAGYGEAVSRRLRPHVRFAETAVGVVVAFLLLPQVARFGSGAAFDREAIVTMAIGMPLGLAAAWQMRRWNASAGTFPEAVAGVFVIAAAVALGVMMLVAFRPTTNIDRLLEIAFLLSSIAGGATLGALVPRARPGHLILGALFVLLAPRLLGMGVLKHVSLYDVVRWTGALGVGGTVGCLGGQRLRAHLATRTTPATNLPAARVHDGDAGDAQDPR